MVQKRGKSNKKNKKRSAIHRVRSKPTTQNFVKEAGPGCHIARRDVECPWVLAWEEVDPAEFEGDQVPDLAIDSDEHTLSLCNVDSVYKVGYITVFKTPLKGRDGKILASGTTIDENNNRVSCTTLIVLCPPTTFVHLCFLPSDVSVSTLELESDVQEWQKHPSPEDTSRQTIAFPLQGRSFLCTQGVDGCLTHYLSGNFHAIDFRCPVRTPLLAVGNGTIVSVKTDTTVTGIAVMNLFSWNSIVLRLDKDDTNILQTEDLDDPGHVLNDGPLFIEYVHIENSTVKVGDIVSEGQVIGTSGTIGFSPEPHLHLAAYRSSDNTAPTCRVYFRTLDGTVYQPQAGQYYSKNGAG